ncbi:hypothetical protein GOBAR_DD05864 [Gossypium barbadense]|nr:hypothetical protein GOBAR_DD05864 [Gossypium barbadense]
MVSGVSNHQPLMASFILSLSLIPFPTSLRRSPLSSRHNLIPASTCRPLYHQNTTSLCKPSLISKTRNLKVHSQLRCPIISPEDRWGTWASLFAIGAFGLWSEKTKIGSMVSAALVSTLVGLAASNLGIIPFEAPAYSVYMRFLLPLAVPLLLFRADLRRVLRSTGTLLLAFLLGSGHNPCLCFWMTVSTIIGTLVAFLMVPMRSLGSDNWKIASALMGSYIGGSVNYIAISEALGVSPSVLAAGVTADNVICAIYFMVLFALASKVAPESSTSTDDVETNSDSKMESKIPVLQSATALAVSFSICKVASHVTNLYNIEGGILPGVTAIVVILATLFPKQFGELAPAGDALALVLMQVFFGVVGASGSIRNVIETAPSIFLFAMIQVAVHLAVMLGLGKLLGFDLKLLLLASNAILAAQRLRVGWPQLKDGDLWLSQGF